MIVVIDDEPDMLDMIAEALTDDGFVVQTFLGADHALEFLARGEPEMIISDIRMPLTDGFEFQAEYLRRFPARRTPFVFLTGLGEADSVVKGLSKGADDYLVKPFVPRVLRAKVRSILKRTGRLASSCFHGDFARMPFVNLVRFCERRGVTGVIEVHAQGLDGVVPFEAGQIVGGGPEGDLDRLLEGLFEVTEGTFTIRSVTVDFSEIAAGAIETTAAAAPTEEKPPGVLSTVEAANLRFQCQTELVTRPAVRIYSIVLLDGQAVLRRAGDLAGKPDRAQLEQMMRDQHAAVESELRERAVEIARARPVEETRQEAAGRLLEQGYDAYRKGDLNGALNLLEKAKKLNPENRFVDANISLVKKKMKSGRALG